MADIDLASLQFTLSRLAEEGRSGLLPGLHAAQAEFGYIPVSAAEEISRVLQVPLADLYGVIEFYSLFYSEPTGKTIVRVCTDQACALAGGESVLEAVCQHLDLQEGQTSPDGMYTVEFSPCLGLCEHAPALLVNPGSSLSPVAIARAQSSRAADLVAGIGERPVGVVGGDLRILTANCGTGQPTSLAEYIGHGGYRGLRAALGISPEKVITEIKASGLLGRGGAAFPTGIKWEGAAQAPGEIKYVVCNADESEPGTFKDRVLLEEDPQRILEGMSIAAYAIGARLGYIYIRGEYPYAYQTMQAAVNEARQSGYLGEQILGTDFSFDIKLRLGAGAYIAGEETALFESIEGKRGFPRLKPPFPTTHGLFGQPTVINNVETFCNVPIILAEGAASYRQIGTAKSSGPKLFCLSGDVRSPGLYEAPFGVTLRRLIELAGGLRSRYPLQAVLVGGAAGSFATPEHLDLPISFEDLRTAGLSLGSGVIMAFDASRDLRDIFMRLARFFAHESCGKCYPCQMGTQRQYEILQRLAQGNPLPGDPDRLLDVGWTMTDASICGLGQTAASAILSAYKLWPHLFTIP